MAGMGGKQTLQRSSFAAAALPSLEASIEQTVLGSLSRQAEVSEYMSLSHPVAMPTSKVKAAILVHFLKDIPSFS